MSLPTTSSHTRNRRSTSAFRTTKPHASSFLLDLARAVSKQILGARVDLPALVHAAGHAATQQRLLLWVTDHSVEAQLARLPIGGVEPQTRAPYFRLALWNSTGSKLDYYIHASLDWASSSCGAKQHVTVTVHLTNSAPDGLPGYVLGADR